MAKFLGLDVFPKRKTDEEFIEDLRKQQRRRPWLILLMAAVAVLHFAAAAWVIFKMEEFITGLTEVESLYHTGLALGLVIGIFAGYLLMQGVEALLFIIQTGFHDRANKMLIEYHDACMELAGEAPPAEGS